MAISYSGMLLVLAATVMLLPDAHASCTAPDGKSVPTGWVGAGSPPAGAPPGSCGVCVCAADGSLSCSATACAEISFQLHDQAVRSNPCNGGRPTIMSLSSTSGNAEKGVLISGSNLPQAGTSTTGVFVAGKPAVVECPTYTDSDGNAGTCTRNRIHVSMPSAPDGQALPVNAEVVVKSGSDCVARTSFLYTAFVSADFKIQADDSVDVNDPDTRKNLEDGFVQGAVDSMPGIDSEEQVEVVDISDSDNARRLRSLLSKELRIIANFYESASEAQNSTGQFSPEEFANTIKSELEDQSLVQQIFEAANTAAAASAGGISVFIPSSATVPTFIIPCDPIVAPVNGLAGDCASRVLRPGETCTPTCIPGFEAAGEVMCTENGTKSTFRCNASPCDISALLSNFSSEYNVSDTGCMSVLGTGEECRATCPPGFKQTGFLRCIYGTTIGSLHCAPDGCPNSQAPPQGSFVPPNATASDCPPSLPSGGSCQLGCEPGYTPFPPEAAVRNCYAGRLVDSPYFCVRTTCSITDYLATMGNIFEGLSRGTCTDNLPVGASCQLQCSSGYNSFGSPDLVCKSHEAMGAYFEPSTGIALSCIASTTQSSGPCNFTNSPFFDFRSQLHLVAGTCTGVLDGGTCELGCAAGYRPIMNLTQDCHILGGFKALVPAFEPTIEGLCAVHNSNSSSAESGAGGLPCNQPYCDENCIQYAHCVYPAAWDTNCETQAAIDCLQSCGGCAAPSAPGGLPGAPSAPGGLPGASSAPGGLPGSSSAPANLPGSSSAPNILNSVFHSKMSALLAEDAEKGADEILALLDAGTAPSTSTVGTHSSAMKFLNVQTSASVGDIEDPFDGGLFQL